MTFDVTTWLEEAINRHEPIGFKTEAIAMGLDNFWVRKGESDPLELEFDPPLELCGGMFSANGNGSFRGKVYANQVEGITGVSLYEDRINNETISEMAIKLEALVDVDDRDDGLNDLARMFRAYADAGAELISWY